MIEGVIAAAEKIGTAIAEAAEKSAEVVAETAKESAEVAEKATSTIEIKGKPLESPNVKPNMEIVKNRSLESVMIENGELPFPQPEDAPIEFPIEEMPELPPRPIPIPDFPGEGEISILDFLDSDGELVEAATEAEATEATEAEEKVGLTDEEKALIKDETGWSDEIIDHIESMDQYEIYKNAGLHEGEVNGRKCLLKDIDLDYVDPKTGMTNRELMEKGRSPIDSKTGEKIELHHMGQDPNGPFAELCENSEHGDGNHGILHTKFEDSWRNNSELNNQYQTEKRNHWKARAQEA